MHVGLFISVFDNIKLSLLSSSYLSMLCRPLLRNSEISSCNIEMERFTGLFSRAGLFKARLSLSVISLTCQ